MGGGGGEGGVWFGRGEVVGGCCEGAEGVVDGDGGGTAEELRAAVADHCGWWGGVGRDVGGSGELAG